MKYTYDEDLYSDLYKEVFGIRPGTNNKFYTTNEDTKQKMWDNLLNESVEQAEQELERVSSSIKQFEKEILSFEADGYTRNEAIKVVVTFQSDEELNEFTDYSYICYELDLPFEYESIVRNAFMEKV